MDIVGGVEMQVVRQTCRKYEVMHIRDALYLGAKMSARVH